MRTISSVRQMQEAAEDLRCRGKRIGLVPTMGFLHQGHLSLIRLARGRADAVVTTIFVNPAQFAPGEDYGKYPRDIAGDTKLAEEAGTDILFTPTAEEMYPPGYRTYVEVDEITRVLEGASRPTHFRGVATVVAKLFAITRPHIAVFGQKDAQQVLVVRQIARDLNFGIEILVAPIVREADGLAMSSRNVYLSESERTQSTVLSRALRHAGERARQGERDSARIAAGMMKMIASQPSAGVDYISIADPLTLRELPQIPERGSVLISLAVRFGGTRLIDNLLLDVPPPPGGGGAENV